MDNSSPLVIRRICAYALNLIWRELGINQQAHKFIGDDDSHWILASPEDVRVIRGSDLVARIALEYDSETGLPNTARVTVQDIYSIVRDGHLDDFEPENHGIQVDTRYYYDGEKYNDLDVSITLEDLDSSIPGLYGRKRFIPRSVLARKPRLTGSLSG